MESELTPERLVDEPAGPTDGSAKPRRPRPVGARCDACHERQAVVRRSRDELLTICQACARGVDVALTDARQGIAAVVNRAPAAERRALTRRLTARLMTHAARRERRGRPTGTPR